MLIMKKLNKYYSCCLKKAKVFLMKLLQKTVPHALVIIGFVLAALLYFYPVLQGKQIYQSDIAQYTGMAKEQNDFRASEHQEPYWTNGAFGGMPTYQLGANYPHDYIGKIDDALRFLPRPADYLFLYFLGFYLLLLSLKIDIKQAFFGALAFGFSTYLIIILGVGHNAKAHAIAYMPMVLAGFILVFQKNYVKGGLLTLIASALEINANHFQMTYYLFLFLFLFSGYYIFKYLKHKEYKAIGMSLAIFTASGIIALGANATNLLATKEYATFSTRNKSDLTFNADGSKKTANTALSHEYITEYSYGITESLNLIAPRLFGGSNAEQLDENSSLYNFALGLGASGEQAKEFVSNAPTYWGNQPIVAAPAYIGAVVFFLLILCLFANKGKMKYVFLGGALVALALSWGKNFPVLTDFMIDYFPLYDKFRAVSSIQVILELCFPILAILGLKSFLESEKEAQQKFLLQTTVFSIGFLIIIFGCQSFFSFASPNDAYYVSQYGKMGEPFLTALKSDRQTMFKADLLRSAFLILLAAGTLLIFIKNKLSKTLVVIIIGILMVGDLVFVAKKYVSATDFVNSSEVKVPFQATTADLQILQDTTNYRVFEVSGNLSSARASYFHKSIGGYSAVKPRRIQELFDYQIAKNNIEILHLLNVKYLIQTDEKGAVFPVANPDANGNAWFVNNIKLVKNTDEEMKALTGLNSKTTAVVNKNEFKIKFSKAPISDKSPIIFLQEYKPNYLKYYANTPYDNVAVFSEMYYKDGWNAYIDDKLTPHFRADYVLRALEIPAGIHKIEFKFEPKVIKTGSIISLVFNIIIFILLALALFFEIKNNTKKTITSF